MKFQEFKNHNFKNSDYKHCTISYACFNDENLFYNYHWIYRRVDQFILHAILYESHAVQHVKQDSRLYYIELEQDPTFK